MNVVNILLQSMLVKTKYQVSAAALIKCASKVGTHWLMLNVSWHCQMSRVTSGVAALCLANKQPAGCTQQSGLGKTARETSNTLAQKVVLQVDAPFPWTACPIPDITRYLCLHLHCIVLCKMLTGWMHTQTRSCCATHSNASWPNTPCDNHLTDILLHIGNLPSQLEVVSIGPNLYRNPYRNSILLVQPAGMVSS